MVRKPAKMYREIRGQQAYTRKEYMGGVPASRITQFNMGNRHKEYTHAINLISEEKCQVRHNALESARIAATRYFNNTIGAQNFFLQVRVYPHNVIRENKVATGAGADRVSEGMRRSFGKPVGTAARVNRGQIVMTAYVDEENIEKAKQALRRANMKMPTSMRIKIKGVS